MSEFVEVIRQFDRMCNAHEGCTDCRLAETGNMACSICDFIDNPGRIESIVMKWAAEHPETEMCECYKARRENDG